MQYTIVTGTVVDELVKKVNEHIANGWAPLGGVATRPTTNYTDKISMQAMVKVKAKK